MSREVICSFCRNGGGRFVSGKDSVYICERCVRLCCDILEIPLANPEKPALKLWPLLARLAPKAKLSDLADALYEQGYCVNMIDMRPAEADAAPTAKAPLENSHSPSERPR